MYWCPDLQLFVVYCSCHKEKKLQHIVEWEHTFPPEDNLVPASWTENVEEREEFPGDNEFISDYEVGRQ
jgi:hypothetical protein